MTRSFPRVRDEGRGTRPLGLHERGHDLPSMLREHRGAIRRDSMNDSTSSRRMQTGPSLTDPGKHPSLTILRIAWPLRPESAPAPSESSQSAPLLLAAGRQDQPGRASISACGYGRASSDGRPGAGSGPSGLDAHRPQRASRAPGRGRCDSRRSGVRRSGTPTRLGDVSARRHRGQVASAGTKEVPRGGRTAGGVVVLLPTIDARLSTTSRAAPPAGTTDRGRRRPSVMRSGAC
jgi:hypothetical protein